MLIKAMEDNDLSYVAYNMKNLLENVTLKKHKILINLKEEMNKYGAINSMMSGSGPTVFGLFDSEEDALNGKVELLKKYSQVYIVRSSEKGVEING
jgi:4-diphosphocytidyl-2-C-methyl-D-erythritol kinase